MKSIFSKRKNKCCQQNSWNIQIAKKTSLSSMDNKNTFITDLVSYFSFSYALTTENHGQIPNPGGKSRAHVVVHKIDYTTTLLIQNQIYTQNTSLLGDTAVVPQVAQPPHNLIRDLLLQLQRQLLPPLLLPRENLPQLLHLWHPRIRSQVLRTN